MEKRFRNRIIIIIIVVVVVTIKICADNVWVDRYCLIFFGNTICVIFTKLRVGSIIYSLYLQKK